MIFDLNPEQIQTLKSISENYDFFRAVLESHCWETKSGKVVFNFNDQGVLTDIKRPRLEFGEVLWVRNKADKIK